MTDAAWVLAEGTAPYHRVDPDAHRAYVREHKSRALTSKLMSAREAVSRFVQDGDYLVYECNYFQRGPNALVREVIRQRKHGLWLAGKFSYPDVALLVGTGCASKVDCGYFMPSLTVQKALDAGTLEIYEYSNIVMTQRLLAGAMGVSFLPVRSFGGTTGFERSGAKLIEDPYTGRPQVVVPALNPDVALIHVNEADVFGNARIFGTGVSHAEAALASRRVVVSAERIIDTEEIRRDPGATTIPYYAVDAVVLAPFGSYPGTCPGHYTSDSEHVVEIVRAAARDLIAEYAGKWVYAFETDAEMLDALVGARRLIELQNGEPHGKGTAL